VKIALLSFEYPPETGFGGIGTYTRAHARALAQLGHEVHVLAGANAPTPLTQDRDGEVTVWRYAGGGATARAVRALGRLRLWWSSNRLDNALNMYAGLSRLHAEHAFDLVESPECGADGMLVGRLLDLPMVVRLHSPAQLIMAHYDTHPLDRRLCAWLEARALAAACCWTSPTRFLAEVARRELGLERVIPNGLDPAAPAGGFDLRRRLGLAAETPVILFAGRLERRKGIHLCAEIAATVLARHRAALVFAGEDLFGELRQLLTALAGRPLAGSVHAVGRLSGEELRTALAQSEVFLFPSLWENSPYSLLEAMAAGCAVASSDAGGVPEILTHGVDALITPAGDAVAHARAVSLLREEPALRQRLGDEARRTVASRHDALDAAQRALACYRRCLE
jgi:glycosyltransferase involved in cell wall biosynthesis